MASVTIRTQPITREKLARFFPSNHEMVRLIESLVHDVTINIPDVVDTNGQIADFAQALAAGIDDVAQQALRIGLLAGQAPPVVPAVAPVDDQSPPQILAPASDDPTTEIASLRERVTRLETQLNDLMQGTTP